MVKPNPPQFTTRPVIMGTFGVVSSTHWLASQVGMSMLEAGGNAFDAAIATAFALQVVEPHMSGLGGEAVVLMQAVGNDPVVICGQGVAPAGATIAHYQRQGLDRVPGSGLLATVVPGAFDAWMLMLRDYGTMTLARVLEPAMGYARNGWPMTHAASTTIAGVEELFRREWIDSAAIYLPHGRIPQPGELFVNSALFETYSRILKESSSAGGNRERQIQAARIAFYKGFVAESIDTFIRCTDVMGVDGRRHRGVLAAHDLASWEATYENPISYGYRGVTVYKPGPWSQGPVFLQTLALLEAFDIPSMNPAGAEFNHVLLEAMKLAFADRDAWYGDPNFVEVPIQALLSEEYNSDRRRLIGEQASHQLRPGHPDGRKPQLPSHAAIHIPKGKIDSEAELVVRGTDSATARGPSLFAPKEGDTCHFDIIDRDGNVVSATPSGGWLQHSPVIPGLGLSLNIRAQSFWLEDGLASSLGPRRRPRTTLSPTMVLKSGEPMLAFGSPGADNQEQWLLQFFLRHIDHKLNIQAAIDAPVSQTGHLLSSVYPRELNLGKVDIEGRFPEATISELRARGHNVRVVGEWSTAGRVCAVARNGQVLQAAATPRMQQAYAVGR